MPPQGLISLLITELRDRCRKKGGLIRSEDKIQPATHSTEYRSSRSRPMSH